MPRFGAKLDRNCPRIIVIWTSTYSRSRARGPYSNGSSLTMSSATREVSICAGAWHTSTMRAQRPTSLVVVVRVGSDTKDDHRQAAHGSLVASAPLAEIDVLGVKGCPTLPVTSVDRKREPMAPERINGDRVRCQ